MTRQNSLFQRPPKYQPSHGSFPILRYQSCPGRGFPAPHFLVKCAGCSFGFPNTTTTRPHAIVGSSFKSISFIQLGTDRRVLPNTRRQLLALASLILIALQLARRQRLQDRQEHACRTHVKGIQSTRPVATGNWQDPQSGAGERFCHPSERFHSS